jgi:hypothetical protein
MVYCPWSVVVLTRVLDKFCHVLLQRLERRHVDVHHVARFVIGHADVLAKRGIEAEMVEGVFGGEVGRAEIVVAVGDEDLEIFIEVHGAAQSFSDIDILIFEIAVRPLPPNFFAENFVRGVGFKFEFGADVIIERRSVWAVDLSE